MPYIADLHIHSPYSRATSPSGDLAGLCAWARIKGIQVVATGDFTHPAWFNRLKEELVPAEPGLFRLKDETVPPALPGVIPAETPIRFLLSAEVSSIYKRHGKVRKVHNLLYAPDFASAERINATLAGIGNIESDGRPILGLDSRDLLEIMLEKAPEGFLAPAHIWTPWFSLFGSKSGFDTIEECFGDLADHVFALETGLSSDPDMNRRIAALDRFALFSNSDCHSPSKLGREANLFNTELSYFALRDALRRPNDGGFAATIEFFPEEGKYHCDGHRNCKVCLEPEETRKLAEKCPVCGRPLTVGVLHRVLELADRAQPLYPAGAPTVHSLIPLPELLGEIMEAGPATKGVIEQYARLISRFGSEFSLLLDTPTEEIATVSPVLAEAVGRVRAGKVIRTPGYDGEFGVIRVFEQGEARRFAGQSDLFGASRPGRRKKGAPRETAATTPALPARPAISAGPMAPTGRAANPEQQAAIESIARHILVSAGPGTGKTFTLVARAAHLLAHGADPNRMKAITFTNRAASEMQARLTRETGTEIWVGTFHRFCLEWLRRDDPELLVLGEEERELHLRHALPELGRGDLHVLRRQLTLHADGLNRGTIQEVFAAAPPLASYLNSLAPHHVVDLDLVIPLFVERLRGDAALRARVAAEVGWLLVDEFQDLNHAQYELVLLLAEQASIFAIGDPNQAIYGFRGSDLAFFSRFRERAEVTCHQLVRNYRSTPPIVEAASAVIRRNPQAGDCQLLAKLPGDQPCEWHPVASPQEEGERIARLIEEEMGGLANLSAASLDQRLANRGFADFAVLCRLTQVAEPIAEALKRRGIPCQMVGATPFYQRPPLRSALRLILSAAPEASLADLLALCKDGGVAAGALASLEQRLPLKGADLLDQALALPLHTPEEQAIRHPLETASAFRHQARDGIRPALASAMTTLSIDPATEEARRFLDLAGIFGGDLDAFVAHLRENGQATVYDARAEAVAIMTMHAAKGLEFPVVFLAGIEEEVIPCTIATLTPDVAEERRLFYVAMTRARERLVITSAASRTVFNRMAAHRPSRFIQEIPSSLLARIDRPEPRTRPANRQMRLF
ncbi:MAG: UvrD-helicase domain-containing protein [Thermodesulfobacteriota bacterium]